MNSRNITYEKDYLKRKLEALSEYQSIQGDNEQEKFDNCLSDLKRYEYIKFSIVDPSIAVPFIMSYLSKSYEEAQLLFLNLSVKSKKDSAQACKERLESTEKWEPIFLSYFSRETALDIKQDCRDYLQDYRDDALFGVGYLSDTTIGILNFINNTGGITSSLEGYPLLSGSDYSLVKSALTSYFYE